MIDRLGHYHLLERIGAGGMGELFRARDTRLGRTVAVRLLSPDLATHPERRELFLRDARAAAALSHPNITTLFEIGEDGPHRFLAFEYVRGDTLRAIIGGGPLPVGRALDLAAQLADALAEAHAHGIVHRDIRPDTVMVTPAGRAKILDFGLAAWTRGGTARATREAAQFASNPSLLLGVLAYVSPEQAHGLPVDHRTDIFSLGVILHEMLTGRPAFAEMTPAATLRRVVEAAPPPPATVNRSVPAELDAIVTRALARNPDERCQSAAALAADLRGVAAVLATRSSQSGPPTLVARRAASRAGLRWLVALILLALLGAAGWCWSHGQILVTQSRHVGVSLGVWMPLQFSSGVPWKRGRRPESEMFSNHALSVSMP